ncbi:MAG: hypothetical protein CL666_11810 [Balneola sp.]|nr:hypothetical protein [Balneola sp.]|tara:strand:+ start:12066 stop:12569 length:504 start_codon:yes stop_codon:yes gene_type:complete
MIERVFAKNPSELQIIENPNKRRSNMAKESKITTEKAVSEFKQQAITAGYILGGQAVAAQVNALAVPMLTGNASATIQQATRAGIPLTAGVLLTLVTKNKHLRGLAMGMGVQGVMEMIKFVMPDWTPQQGLMDGSSYVYDRLPEIQEKTHHVDEVETSLEEDNTIEV